MYSIRRPPSVAIFRLATNTYLGMDEIGGRREATDFHTIVMVGNPVETARIYLQKGRLLQVEGRLQHRKVGRPAEGQKRTTSEVVADSFLMLTELDAVAREMPISAATCETGWVRQRSTSRLRPSGVNGAFRCIIASVKNAAAALGPARPGGLGRVRVAVRHRNRNRNRTMAR